MHWSGVLLCTDDVHQLGLAAMSVALLRCSRLYNVLTYALNRFASVAKVRCSPWMWSTSASMRGPELRKVPVGQLVRSLLGTLVKKSEG